MRDGLGLPKAAWAGLGILGVGALLLSLGQRENKPFPATDSFAPSGTAAFASLLRKQGFTVVADASQRPQLGPKDTAIVFALSKEPAFFGEGSQPPADEPVDPLETTLLTHFEKGGSAIVLPLDFDFLQSSRNALTAPAKKLTPVAGKRSFDVTVSGDVEYNDLLDMLYGQYGSTSVYRLPDGTAGVLGISIPTGAAFLLDDGLPATNRFLDKADNAAFLLHLVSAVTPEGGRVVFTEAAFGNIQEKGILQTIGAWADAGWQQLVLLGAVIIYTLGKRLGLPEQERRKERGTRELVDAFADTMQRAQSTQLAMQIALDRGNSELRRVLKLPKDADRLKMHDRLPLSLQKALVSLEVASKDKETSSSEATRRIRRLDAEIAEFVGTGRRKSRQKATITP